MKLNDSVMVRPTHSIKFGGRWGIIVKIDHSDDLPYKLKFHLNSSFLYGFSKEELMDTKSYLSWGSNITCQYCGVNIDGLYSYLCDECQFPMPKEDENNDNN